MDRCDKLPISVKEGQKWLDVHIRTGTLVAYVGDRWINVRGVTFTVGERTYGPYADVYSKPARIEAGGREEICENDGKV